MRIDLHSHSTASDGSKRPAEVIGLGVEWAEKNKEPVVMALTDHDTVAGVAEFLGEASKYPGQVTAVPGIEFSTFIELEDGREQTMHMLGYFIDHDDPVLLEKLEKYRQDRESRNTRVIEKLNRHGFRISAGDIEPLTPGASVGRPAIASHMVKMGYVSSVKEAFKKYLGRGKLCYAERIRPQVRDVISLIHASGGIAVLAHPKLYDKLDHEALDKLISDLCSMGLDGLEVYYSRNDPEDTAYYHSLAEKYHLRVTGGSDFHGTVKPDIELFRGTGNLHVPVSVLESLKDQGDL